MTKQNEKLQNESHNLAINHKYKHYPLIEAVAKSVLIDGFATFIMFSIPKIPKIGTYIAPLPELSFVKISLLTTAYTLMAIPSYFVRSEFRYDEREYDGAVIGGCIKYTGREILAHSLGVTNEIDKNLAMKCLIGSANSLWYEGFTNFGPVNSTLANFGFTAFWEALESYHVPFLIKTDLKPVQYSQLGFLGGIFGATGAIYLYMPSIDYIKESYDMAEDYFTAKVENFMLSINNVTNQVMGEIEFIHQEL